MRSVMAMRGRARTLCRDRRGSAGVEFAMLSPAFCLILVGTIDFGSVLHTRFRLDSAVSAGANYAVVNATKVSAANGPSLASSIAAILRSSNTSNSTTGTVVVNNGPQSTLANGVATPGGSSSNADSCYCPSLVSGAISWGAARTCGSACTGGGLAGKFVTISAQQAYSPSFSNYGIVSNGSITSSVVVQTQ
jgi:Flp pilus assembly protein TadG